MFTQLGHSVKKVFKKKASVSDSRLKKTMSVQHNLRQHASSPLNSMTKKQMYSSLRAPVKAPNERPKVFLESFATYIPTEPITDASQVQVYNGSCPSSVSSLHSHRSPPMIQPQQNYWDGEATQSQQFDQLLDDIWERSQEYQDYFAAEEQNLSNSSFSTNFNNHFKNNAVWSPNQDNNITVRPSKTEGNMNKFDEGVPFVSVGQSTSQDSKRKSQLAKGNLNIEDVKAYKRSTSAYSNIRDYDLNWQASFHVEQKSRDKVAKTLKSVSWAFYNIIKRNHNLNEFACDAIFSENEYQVSDGSNYNLCSEPLTDWNDIYDQLAYVFDCGELTAEHAIITLIYVKRMLDLSRQSLWDFSWRMIVMSSLLTAVKVWDDCAIFNADFAMIFPELTLDVINTIERVFLTHLEWDVSVNCSDFARTYFHLRDIEHMMDQW
ncbi:uncharacterized protein EV154DRAFT_518230 [Mucor mucedo]|uniref:uncharacterized protein n=1 Tax=Mucor mucedo TaxID=29922 RepID=UPI002220AAE2|nr:uncharacterized protein EV154DRAFT_518230 [Mucor mucedo]KAI7888301.1 hypothetical protein EV154DRAFT_518230 [Mucor mucedo]